MAPEIEFEANRNGPVIKLVVESLHKHLQPIRVMKGGSAGKNTETPNSDVDLICALNDFDYRKIDKYCEKAKRALMLEVPGCLFKRDFKHGFTVQVQGCYFDILFTGDPDANKYKNPPEFYNCWYTLDQVRYVKSMKARIPKLHDAILRLKRAKDFVCPKAKSYFLELLAIRVLESQPTEGFDAIMRYLSRKSSSLPHTLSCPVTGEDVTITSEHMNKLINYASGYLFSGGRATYESAVVSWEGSHKYVHKGTYTKGKRTGEQCVVKAFKSGPVYSKVDFSEDLSCISKAREIAEAFNAVVNPCRRVTFNDAEVWVRESQEETKEHLLVEPMISGDYHRFNSNTGFQKDHEDIMAALSHFSYHYTGGTAVLCDLQGGRYHDKYILTDPVILSPTLNKYGPTDLGQAGIENFFSQHECNKICHDHGRQWSLPYNARQRFKVVEGSTLAVRGAIHYGLSVLPPVHE